MAGEVNKCSSSNSKYWYTGLWLSAFSGLSNRSQSIGSSLEELQNCFPNSDAVLSIEELRLQLNSCFT
jgi:hypothetical protein